MRGWLALLAAAVAALPLASSAAAAEAPRRLTSADEKRAASMLIGAADLADGFRRAPNRTDEPASDCPALDESDLVVTGEADALYTLRRADLFVRVGTSATVYRTQAQAARSWRRGTSRAGLACLRRELGRSVAKEGLAVASLRRLQVPSVAPRTFAVRVVLTGAALPVDFFYDVVVVSHGRAVAALGVLGLGAPVPDSARTGFARLVSGRMKTALGLPAGPSA